MSDPTRATGGAVAGTVAILGRPNVGKSTLLNAIVGQKLAIVTPKPQTTRNRIVGVWSGDAGQIVFVDTPGVHAARSALNKAMVETAFAALADVEAVLLVIDVSAAPARSASLPAAAAGGDPVERRLIERVLASGKPVVLALNKVDRVKDKTTLLPTLEAWTKRAPFAALVPVSATRGVGVPGIVAELCKLMPTGAPLYGPDMLTDRTERFLVAELIREQLFLRLFDELPYSVAVEIEAWHEREDRGDVVIDASILVERETQKAIVVGKAGAMIRDLGTKAREEATALLGRPAHLKLTVKVAPAWTESPEALARLGYGGDDGGTP